MRRADAGATARPAAVAALLACALFFARGASDLRLFWIGTMALLLAAAAAVWRPRHLGVPASLLLALLGTLAVWEGVTIAWSIHPSGSWDSANRGLVYLAFACLGVWVSSYSRTRVAAGIGALFALVLIVALAGKVFAGLYGDYGRLARLRWPLAYWNELALVAATTVPLGLWLAGRRDRPLRARVAGALHVYVGVVAVVLTFSRFGILLAVLGALAWLWIDRERFDSLGALVSAVPPGAVVAGVALALPGIANNGVSHHTRARDGAIFAALLVVGAAVTAAGAWFALAREPDPVRRRRAVRAGAAVLAGVVVVAIVVLVVRKGGPVDFVRAAWRQFSTTQSVNAPGRIASASSGNRWTWWQESWTSFTHHPGGGTGAGSFGLTSYVDAHNKLTVTVEPHNTPLQFLAETGIVGFLLYLGVVATVVVGVLRGPRDRATLALALVAAVAWLHSVVDIDWLFVATQAPLFVIAGVLVGRPAPPAPRRIFPLAAVVVCCLAALYSLFAPWYSRQRLQDGLNSADPNASIAAFEDAHKLNPLSIDPLLFLGAVQDDPAPYVKATKREPRNPDTWYALAEHYALNREWRLAYDAANRSYKVDPYGPAGQPGKRNVLNVARCHVFPTSPQCPPAP